MNNLWLPLIALGSAGMGFLCCLVLVWRFRVVTSESTSLITIQSQQADIAALQAQVVELQIELATASRTPVSSDETPLG